MGRRVSSKSQQDKLERITRLQTAIASLETYKNFFERQGELGVVKTCWWLIRMIIKLMGGGVSSAHPSPSSMIIVLIQSGAKESGFSLKQRPGIWQCLYQM